MRNESIMNHRQFYIAASEYPMWKYYIDIILDKIFNRTNEDVSTRFNYEPTDKIFRNHVL